MLCLVSQWWLQEVIHFPKFTEHVNTMREPESKLWVIVMPPGKFTGCNKCFPLVGMLIMGKAMHVQGAKGVQETPVASPQFCCEP